MKSYRVTISSIEGEFPAFAEGFDRSFHIRHDLKILLRVPIPLLMLTDSKQVFDILTRRRYTSSKPLMIYIESIWETYDSSEISNIALMNAEYNATDTLTKLNRNYSLWLLLSSDRIYHTIEQFVVREKFRHPEAKKGQWNYYAPTKDSSNLSFRRTRWTDVGIVPSVHSNRSYEPYSSRIT